MLRTLFCIYHVLGSRSFDGETEPPFVLATSRGRILVETFEIFCNHTTNRVGTNVFLFICISYDVKIHIFCLFDHNDFWLKMLCPGRCKGDESCPNKTIRKENYAAEISAINKRRRPGSTSMEKNRFERQVVNFLSFVGFPVLILSATLGA